MRLSIVSLLCIVPLVWGCDRIPGLHKAVAVTTHYDYSLDIEMTPAAAASLKASGDSLIVSSFYYGFPTPAFAAKGDELHRLELGYQAGRYSATARHIRVVSTELDTRLLPQVVNRDPYVLVTIISADPSGFEEMLFDRKLGCETYIGPIKALQATRHTLHCDVYKA